MPKRGEAQTVATHGALPWEDAAWLRLIADNVPAMTIAYDEKLICRFANRRFAEFFGLTTQTIVGRHLRDIIGEAPYREVKPYFDKVLAGERAAYKRTRTARDGRRQRLEVELMPYIGEDRRVRGLFAVTTDATARQREEQLRMLGMSVAARIADADSTRTAIRAVIRAVCESEGWECGRYLRPVGDGRILRQVEAWGIDDPKMQRFLEISGTFEHARGQGLVGTAMESGEPLWIVDTSSDPRAYLHDHFRDIGLSGAFVFPVKVGGQTIGVLTFHSRQRRLADEPLLSTIVAFGAQVGEFLERKRAEDELREERSRLRTIVESASEGILVYDRDGLIVSANGAAERILGLPKERLIGAAGFVDLLPCIREDGRPVGQEDRNTLRVLRERRDLTGSVIGIRREGGPTTWLVANNSLLYDPALPAQSGGEPYGAVTTLTDITVLKREQSLLRLEQRVARAFDSASDVPAALRAAIQAVCEAEDWDSGRYLEVAGDELRPVTDWCVEVPPVLHYIEMSRGMSYKRGVGMVGRAWQERKAVWAADIANDPRVARPSLARETGTRGSLAVPVLAQDEVIGTFIFQCRQVRQPDERLLQAMQLVGAHIGQLVRRAKAEEAVRESEARFRSLCELSSDIFWEQDAEYRFTAVTDAADRLDLAEFIGRRRWELSYANMSEADWAAHRAMVEAHQPFRDLELCHLDRTGAEVWYSVSGEPVFDARRTDKGEAAFAGYRGVGRDITARKADERRIRHLASHDALTGLPNRSAFSELLNAARHSAARHGRALAVLFVDLDRFKIINDTLGHEAGDQVLRHAALRLRDTLRSSDVVARLGGDEFVVMIPELDEPAQAETAARKVLAGLARPLSVGGHELTLTASIGISLYPDDGMDEQALMKAADAAMYRAKAAGKNTFKFHHREGDRRSVERLAMEAALRRALERDEFVLHYQPRVSLDSGRVTAVEALLRWQHPELGLVPPGDFIPLAEETGMIIDIGRWALAAACAQAAAWREQGLPPVRVGVNVSARQFGNDDLVRHVATTLALRRLPPDALELEITESLVAHNVERAARILASIRGLGVRIALDDFGTGYSSLAQLKRFPIDTLKVDRAFVAGLPGDAESAAIARAIIAMGRSLRMHLVAEGVETPEQQAFLQAHGCDEVQGFFVSRPLTADDCAAFVRRTGAT